MTTLIKTMLDVYGAQIITASAFLEILSPKIEPI